MSKWPANRRSMIRWGIGLLLLPWSIVSAALFLYTSGPVPRSFRSWVQLGCLPGWSQSGSELNDSKPQFFGLIKGGDFYATLVHHNSDFGPPSFDLNIVDIASNRPLWVIRESGSDPGAVHVSLNRQFALLQFPWFSSRLYQLPDGNLLQGEGIGQGKAVFASSGDQLLVQGFSSSVDIFHLNGDKISRNRYPQVGLLGRLLDFYFDLDNRPKALVVSNGLVDLLDIGSGRRDWSSAKATTSNEFQIGPEIIPDLGQVGFASPNKAIFITKHHSLGVCVRSLKDGSVLDIHKLAEGASLLNCSPDGHYLLYVRPPNLDGIKKLRKLSKQFEKWLDEFKVEKKLVALASELCVLDVESGETWSGMNIGNGTIQSVAFRESAQTFLTAADNGVYEWDLPPHLRWFTPWAWPALAVWLFLAIAWRRLKTDRRSPQLPSPIP